MFSMRILRLGGAILLIGLFSLAAMSCSAASTKPLTAKATGAQPSKTSGEYDADVSTQGGTLGDVDGQEPNSADESSVEADGTDPALSEKTRQKSDVLSQQLSRHKYSEFQPTEEMLSEIIVGYYKIENAEFLPDKSTGYRSEKAEIIEAWYKMPKDSDYRSIVDTYAGNLEEGVAKQEMDTDKGRTAYFVTHDKNKMWNKVISIWQYSDGSLIEIHVMFNRRFEKSE